MGAGRIGQIHAATLASLEDVEQVLITDIDRSRAAALARDVSAQSVADLDTLLEQADALVIASSAGTHAPFLHRAAEAAVPTLCEKPIALDLKTSSAAVQAVERAGITAQIGFQRRFDRGYQSLRDRIARGDIGALYLLRHVSHDHETPPADYVAGSGGIYKDNLIHDFDVARFLAGDDVLEVYATGSVLVAPYFAEHDDVDVAAVTLRFRSGALAIMSGTRHDPVGYDVRVEAFGSEDSLAAGWNERTPLGSVDGDAEPPADPYRTWLGRFADAYRLELQSFVEAVDTGDVGTAATPRDAHEALRIAVACQLSQTEQRAIRLEELP